MPPANARPPPAEASANAQPSPIEEIPDEYQLLSRSTTRSLIRKGFFKSFEDISERLNKMSNMRSAYSGIYPKQTPTLKKLTKNFDGESKLKKIRNWLAHGAGGLANPDHGYVLVLDYVHNDLLDLKKAIIEMREEGIRDLKKRIAEEAKTSKG